MPQLFLPTTQVGLWPMVRISGADLNGSDLLLPANLTSDRQGLTVETPLERSPLNPGDHRVHISLNGQQFTKTMLLDSTVPAPPPSPLHY